jgi:hypothetical protein
MCSIRRTRYGSFEHPIRLAFFSGIEGHPELIDDAPPPTPPQPKAERAPAMTETFVRKVLGKPRRPSGQEARTDLHYRQIVQRVERQGF